MSPSICKKIHNRYLNPSLIERAVKALEVRDEYSDWLAFKSPSSDGQVISLNQGDDTITISMSERDDMEFQVQGEEETVKHFIKELTAEVTSIAASELCQCLRPDLGVDKLRQIFRGALSQAINDAIPDIEE